MVYTIELYNYRGDDIFTMTDEKENKGTNRWPSKDNIVGLLPTTSSGFHVSLPGKIEFTVKGHGHIRAQLIVPGCAGLLL